MIRCTDEQWERIRDHFPEENIADGRPGRKPTPNVLCARSGAVDPSRGAFGELQRVAFERSKSRSGGG